MYARVFPHATRVKATGMPLTKIRRVFGHKTGHLDDEHIAELVLRLRNATVRKRHGDVMLELSAIRSVTTKFMSVFDSFRRQLCDQHRQLFLNGIDHLRVYRLD